VTDPAAERKHLHPAVWAAILGLILWSLAPFRLILHHHPWKVDAIKWVTQGSLENPTWFRWVFRSHHFVGYRPVAAASFLANHATSGFHPEGYRLTDFALHGLVAVSIALLATRLIGKKSAWVLLPVLLYVGHPAIEEALPYLARRSYLLSTLFSTLGLTVWLDSLESEGPLNARAWAATALFTLGVLSNEAAYVLLPLLPLLGWHTLGLREGLPRAILPWAPALPAIAARFAVLGWAGGYTKHYFAFTRAGKKTLREVYAFNFPDILGAAYDYLWFPVSFKGADTLTEHPAAVFAISSFYFWAIFVEPVLHIRDRQRRMPLILGVWFAGYAMLYGLSRTWFWRQGYPMVTPLALVVGWIAYDTATRYRHAPVQLIARFIPQIALVVGILWFSPMVRGMTTGPIQGRFEGNAILYEMETTLDGLEGPAQVYTIFPLNKGSTRNAHTWLGRLYRDRDIRFTSLAFGGSATNVARVDGSTLVLGPQTVVPAGVKRSKNITDNRVDLRRLPVSGRTTYVAFPNSTGEWTLLPVKSAGGPH